MTTLVQQNSGRGRGRSNFILNRNYTNLQQMTPLDISYGKPKVLKTH